jgi:branched-chain amino acid transport system substrate-binding protein
MTMSLSLRALLCTFLVLLAAPARAEIVIATVGPMSGQYASIGEQMAKGAQKAVDMINSSGGVLGQRLKLEVFDDACEPKQATLIANQIVDRDIRFVAGHFCSSSSIPASMIYDEGGVIMVSPASTSPILTESGLRSVFRICGRDDQQGLAAAAHIARHYRDANIAIIHDKSAYGKGLADETRKALKQKGIEPAMYEAVTAGDRDFSTLITRMKRENIGFIFLGGYHTEAGLIRRQATDLGLKAPLMAGDALVTKEFWTITGEAGEGTYLTFSPDPRDNPLAEDAVTQFRKAGYEPEGYTLYNYAVIQVLAQAMQAAGSIEPIKVIEAMRETEFNTVRGPVRFDEKGDVMAPNYVIYQWRDGNYTMLPDQLQDQEPGEEESSVD